MWVCTSVDVEWIFFLSVAPSHMYNLCVWCKENKIKAVKQFSNVQYPTSLLHSCFLLVLSLFSFYLYMYSTCCNSVIYPFASWLVVYIFFLPNICFIVYFSALWFPRVRLPLLLSFCVGSCCCSCYCCC